MTGARGTPPSSPSTSGCATGWWSWRTATGSHVCVPLQGSGTFAVEAMIGTFVPKSGKLLILINGAYGKRAAKICDYSQRAYATLEWAEDRPVDPADVAATLKDDPAITHVFVVHCETTSGVLNPIEEIAAVVEARRPQPADRLHERLRRAAGRCARGAVRCAWRPRPTNASKACPAWASSSPASRRWKPAAAMPMPSASTSTTSGWRWRRMPSGASPRRSMCIVAFDQALKEHEAEGGVAGRGARYRHNCKILVDGMRSAGLRDPAARRAAGADHRHLPHAGRSELRVRAVL